MKSLFAMIAAGLWGAIKWVVILALEFTLVVSAPAVLTSLADRGAIDLDGMVPHETTTAAQGPYPIIEGTAQQQAAVRSALDKLVWPVDASGLKIVVANPPELPPNSAGMYVFPTNIVYLSEYTVDNQHKGNLHQVLAHELGHMFDSVYLDGAGRTKFMQLRGFAPGMDWSSSSAEWNARPSEDFAEVYAALDVPYPVTSIQTRPGALENRDELRALIAQYQPGPARQTSARVATALSVARDVADTMQTDPVMLELMIPLAIGCAMFGAVTSMKDASYAARTHRGRPVARVPANRIRPHGA